LVKVSAVLEFHNIGMRFEQAGAPGRQVLDGVSFSLAAGDTASLVGRSGSGKSTLLHLAAGISVPTTGQVHLAGQDLGKLDEQARTSLRRRHVGLVFQFFHLLPHLSVGENVALPGWVAGRKDGDLAARTRELLGRVGLLDRAGDPVARLSGGEMQRVAICRALLLAPDLVLADEPTGSLDDQTGRQVMDLLLEMVKLEGGTLLYVTHSRELAGAAGRTWRLHDGRLQDGDHR
jgi:putative ABC transport system ATP-binding protein